MAEILIDGELFLRWLRSDAADLALLAGCEFDDGERENLLSVTGADRRRQVLICVDDRGEARIAFSRLSKGFPVVPPGHPLIAAVEAGLSLQERADREAQQEMGPEFAIQFTSSVDLNRVHAAVMAFRANRLPEEAERYDQFDALKRNRLYAQGARIAERWRDLAKAAGAPWADIALNLAWFLRVTEQPLRAISAVEEFWRARGPRPSPRLRAALATVEAAAYTDKFERRGGQRPDLVAAWNAIGRAWAIEAERDHPEVSSVYRRLEGFGPDPRRSR
ncbi:MAG: hypothetical protein EPO51_14510 [Phenylobacterium sp.]|uniref:hypothetical protein n=1 Tax=Phenylobacterium sp. TaxID=1871053 RepID=UPI0012211976|nr:hypothetical protein [Phenylobacterium sp.]TAJ71490.1 MAG: hypothetical protein EPO51_14510 [Phenylobacterium sp.]